MHFFPFADSNETHRRAKSILKNKSDSSRILFDQENERLLSDNMSGSGISDISVIAVSLKENF